MSWSCAPEYFNKLFCRMEITYLQQCEGPVTNAGTVVGGERSGALCIVQGWGRSYYTKSYRLHCGTVLQHLCCGEAQTNAHNRPFSLSISEGMDWNRGSVEGVGGRSCFSCLGRGKTWLPPPDLHSWCALLGEDMNKCLWCKKFTSIVCCTSL